MKSLDDLLDTVRGEPRWRTLVMAGTDWTHPTRSMAAFERFHSWQPGSHSVRIEATVQVEGTEDGSAPAAEDTTWKLWLERPDRSRAEFLSGRLPFQVVQVGDTWWSWSPSAGAHTNGGDPAISHGGGAGSALVDWEPALIGLELEVVGGATRAGRRVLHVIATPRKVNSGAVMRFVSELGLGAEYYRLDVDSETGVLLRSEAVIDKEPFKVIEVSSLEVDGALDDDTFRLVPDDGSTFTVVRQPRWVAIEKVADEVEFAVFVPPASPGLTAPHVLIHPADTHWAPTESVHITYPLMGADGEQAGNLWLVQSAEVQPPHPDDQWTQVRDLLVSSDQESGYLRVKVRLQQAGTHIRLECTALTIEECCTIAESLVALPRSR